MVIVILSFVSQPLSNKINWICRTALKRGSNYSYCFELLTNRTSANALLKRENCLPLPPPQLQIDRFFEVGEKAGSVRNLDGSIHFCVFVLFVRLE